MLVPLDGLQPSCVPFGLLESSFFHVSACRWSDITVKHVFDGARRRCRDVSLHNEFVVLVSVLFVVSRIQRRVLYSIS